MMAQNHNQILKKILLWKTCKHNSNICNYGYIININTLVGATGNTKHSVGSEIKNYIPWDKWWFLSIGMYVSLLSIYLQCNRVAKAIAAFTTTTNSTNYSYHIPLTHFTHFKLVIIRILVCTWTPLNQEKLFGFVTKVWKTRGNLSVLSRTYKRGHVERWDNATFSN